MSSYKILAEPAKTSRGRCKACKGIIQQDTIRVQVVDDREFNAYIRRNGGRSAFQGEGMYRGYIEAEKGCISIQKYFVHLNCYRPIKPHPYQKEFFRCEHFSARHKADFDHWIQERAEGIVRLAPPRTAASRPVDKKKPIKKAKVDRKSGARGAKAQKK